MSLATYAALLGFAALVALVAWAFVPRRAVRDPDWTGENPVDQRRWRRVTTDEER